MATARDAFLFPFYDEFNVHKHAEFRREMDACRPTLLIPHETFSYLLTINMAPVLNFDRFNADGIFWHTNGNYTLKMMCRLYDADHSGRAV
jgi:hypothetical protein